MRILTWHVHGAWSTAFVHGRHEQFVPVDDERGPDGRGRMQTVRWPEQAREVTREEAQDLDVDLVVLQRPHELEHLCADWLGGRVPGRDVPAVYVEHDTPQGRVNELRHPAADRPDPTEVPRAVPPAAGLVSDDLDELRAGLRRFVDDPGAARETGRAARAHALEHHALARFHRDWDALLERVA